MARPSVIAGVTLVVWTIASAGASPAGEVSLESLLGVMADVERIARGPGDFVELEIPAADDAPRRLLLDVTKAPDFGRLAFSVDGVESGPVFDAWGPEVAPGGTVDLGTHVPRDGRFLLRVEVTGANDASIGPRFFFGLDCPVLEPGS